jgi:hypothetical protein
MKQISGGVKINCVHEFNKWRENAGMFVYRLFKTDGSIGLIYLLAGQLDHFIDNTPMLEDSLMCESGYIFNFDDNTLDFYAGAQTSPDPQNLFGQKIARAFEGKSYYPCKRILQVSLSNPMSCSEWASMIEEK